MTAMLRLDPTRTPLWRDATTMQLGEHAQTRLTDVSPWQERLLFELTRGLPESGVDVWAELQRVHPREVRAFLARLGDALTRTDLERRSTAGGVVLEAPRGGSDDPVVVIMRMALEASGHRVTVVEEADPGDHDRAAAEASGADLVVIIARHVLDPRRAAPHLRADRVHLPVVIGSAAIVVGPLIVPGVTACITCLHLERRDADSAWPLLALQLLSTGAPAPAPELVHEGAAALIRILADPGAAGGRSVSLSAGGEREERMHRPHGECGCRAPEGNATVPVPLSRSRRTTTTRQTSVPA
jgi:hypothetical protein